MKTYKSKCSWSRHEPEVTVLLYVPAALPLGKEPTLPIWEQTGWAPEPVWTTWRGEFYRDSNSDSSAVHPVDSHYTDGAIPARKVKGQATTENIVLHINSREELNSQFVRGVGVLIWEFRSWHSRIYYSLYSWSSKHKFPYCIVIDSIVRCCLKAEYH
jgi:hypothetical protein